MDRIGDALEFAYLWALLPKDLQRGVVRQISRGIIDRLRDEGTRVDGDDVAIFACCFCLQRPSIVISFLGSDEKRWDCCQHASSMMTIRAFKQWTKEKRQSCSFVVESSYTGLAARLFVQRLYLPGRIIVEYIKGIAPAHSAPRTFGLPMRILGGATE